jgi:hypothetical protein
MFKLMTGGCCVCGLAGKVAKTRKKGSPSGNHLSPQILQTDNLVAEGRLVRLLSGKVTNVRLRLEVSSSTLEAKCKNNMDFMWMRGR